MSATKNDDDDCRHSTTDGATCQDCNKSLQRNAFSNKQWKKKRTKGSEAVAVCRKCMDARQKQQQQQQSAAGSSSSKRKKMAVVEEQCATCQKTFAVSKQKAAAAKKRQKYCSNHRSNGAKKPLFHCDECEAKIQRKKDYRLYMEHYGVAYKPLDDCRFSKEPIRSREDLLGNYTIIYIESERTCCVEEECHHIHRSTRGQFRFTLAMWNNQPALYGTWRVDNCFEGTVMDGKMIEAVTEKKKYTSAYNGFNIFPSDYDNSKDTTDAVGDSEETESDSSKFFFVMDRGYDRTNGKNKYKWWDDLPLDDDDDSCAAGDRLDDYCGASVQVIGNKRIPLALAKTDFLPSPDGTGIVSLANAKRGGVYYKLKSIDEADAMLKRYRDGSNSWMCQHLPGMNPQTAFAVREFISPPPVLFVEPGDLLLEVEESSEPEWHKYFVLRRKTE